MADSKENYYWDLGSIRVKWLQRYYEKTRPGLAPDTESSADHYATARVSHNFEQFRVLKLE